MQEDDNLHTRLNPQEDSSASHQSHYSGTSQHPPIQQHSNPQVAYPPYGDQNRQGQHVAPAQGNSSQDALRDITMWINTQFGWCGCYMCLVYLELVISIFSVVMSILAADQGHAVALLVILNVILTLPMLVGCILAIQARLKLNKSNQYIAFVLFVISNIVGFGLSIMIGIWTEWAAISIIGLVIRSFIGLFLIFGAYSLYQLLRDRDRIISMQGNNLFDSVVQA